MQKIAISALVLLFFCIGGSSLYATQRTVKLNAYSCTSGSATQISNNTAVLQRATKNDMVLILPAGSIELDAVTMNNFSNFTLTGTLGENGEFKTNLIFAGDTGLEFSNAQGTSVENIKTTGFVNSKLLSLHDGGSLKVKNYVSTTTPATNEVHCLVNIAEIIVPVLMNIL